MRELEDYQYQRVMEGEMIKKVRLISHPTVLERIKSFLLFLRTIQGKLDTKPRGTGDFVGGDYED